MITDEAASDVLKSFYRGDTLDIFYEMIGPDSDPLDISGFKMEFSMKLNPLSEHYGKHDVRQRFDIPFDGNSRKGLGKFTVKTRDTLRLIGKTPYTYFFDLLSPHGDKFTIGSDLVTVKANPSAVHHAFPYTDNPTTFPRNANSQILVFDFSKLKDQRSLMTTIKKGLATPYSNAPTLSIDELGNLPMNEIGGIAGLNAQGKIPMHLLPPEFLQLIQNAKGGPKTASAVFVASSEGDMLNLAVKLGDLVHRTDTGKTYANQTGDNITMLDWQAIGSLPLIVSATAPANPVEGQRWFNTNTGRLGTWYAAGTGGNWVSS